LSPSSPEHGMQFLFPNTLQLLFAFLSIPPRHVFPSYLSCRLPTYYIPASTFCNLYPQRWVRAEWPRRQIYSLSTDSDSCDWHADVWICTRVQTELQWHGVCWIDEDGSTWFGRLDMYYWSSEQNVLQRIHRFRAVGRYRPPRTGPPRKPEFHGSCQRCTHPLSTMDR